MDYETNSSLAIHIRGTEGNRTSVNQYVVSILDVNESVPPVVQPDPFEFNATALSVSEDALVGTEVGSDSDGNPVIAVITNITGDTYTDPTQLPDLSSEWYTENPDDLGTYIQIQFGDVGGDGFVMPAEGQAILGLVGSIYDSIPDEQLPAISSMASVFEGAAINGDGDSIPGLAAITGKDVNEDLDGDDTNGIQSIQSVVTQEVSEAITQLTDTGNQKTADEIFREAIEDTLIELESYDPDIFGA